LKKIFEAALRLFSKDLAEFLKDVAERLAGTWQQKK
jgi:hypothetical protein